MAWNTGGPDDQGGTPNPWGSPPGDRGADRGAERPGGPRGRGPWGGGRPGNAAPDIDEAIAWLQNLVRGGMGGGGGGGRRPGRRLPAGRGLALLAAAVVLVWLATGFYRVEPDEQGVVLRFGAYDRTTPPGLSYHIPWPIESVQTPAVTRINRVEVGYRSGSSGQIDSGRDVSGRDVLAESLMLTGDENIIDIDFAVFWRISDASAYLFATRDPDGIVRAVSESVMREVIGRTPIQRALTDARAQIEADVSKIVQGVLEQYGTGVEITQVQLQKVDPPADVIESFRDVQRANTDAERMRNEAESVRNDIVPRARGDAAAILAAADGQRQAAVAQSNGEAQRFLSVLKAYEAAKDVTMQRLYLETMQDILTRTPTTVVDDKLTGIVPYLPLGGGGAPLPVPPGRQITGQPQAAAGGTP